MSVFSRFQGKPMPDSRGSCGGVKEAKPIANYKPPVGPKGIDHKGPGLGGKNHGPSGTQGKR
jgi:hypothetical protein